jgi:uncharacterized membrane protein
VDACTPFNPLEERGNQTRVEKRLVFVDILRGWATIVMIEVHVFNAFLISGFKETEWFGILNYVNGLVAPSFLFVAGFVFVIASDRKLEEFRTYGKAFWRQISRIGLIWVVGYALHLPFFSLTRTMNESSTAQWLSFSQSDILHCIAVGMLAIFLGRIFIKSDKVYQWFLVCVGGIAVIIAPLIWDIDFYSILPPMLAGYLDGKTHSLFPLFPWLGFLMFGGVTAFAFKKARGFGKEKEYFIRLSLVGAGLLALGSLLVELPSQLSGVSVAARANPLFFASRIGIIFLLLAACWLYAEWRKTERSFVLDVSKESLLVYTLHLVVIYSEYVNGKSLDHWYGGTLSVMQCIVVTLVLTLAMIIIAQAWSWLKKTSMPWAKYISYATGIFLLMFFIVRKS